MVKSVRLACLMCAASVYPEPGSNSLVFGIYSLKFSFKYISFLIKFFSSFLYFFRYISFLEIYRFGLFSKGFYCLLFNVLLCPLFVEHVALYYTYFCLSILFRHFFIFYEKLQNKKLVMLCFIIFFNVFFITNSCVSSLFFSYVTRYFFMIPLFILQVNTFL